MRIAELTPTTVQLLRKPMNLSEQSVLLLLNYSMIYIIVSSGAHDAFLKVKSIIRQELRDLCDMTKVKKYHFMLGKR